jgi:putative ABC transport system ATP-binding protein
VTAVVTAEAVAKWWAPNSGLRPVSFTVSAGQFVVVRGRSGSGKSTLLSLLAGWSEPDEGALSWHRDVRGQRTNWDRVAVVPQVLALIPELTVHENITIAGVTIDHRLVDDVMERLDLTDLRDRFPDETSLGQQQRTAIARAAVASPVLLLADEPTCHQDPHHVGAILELLGSLASTGSALLVATHEPVVVAAATQLIELGG